MRVQNIIHINTIEENMYIILTYDIGKRRIKKIHKICLKYLHHVQKSVFEGEITEMNIRKLKEELTKTVIPQEDSICIYKVDTPKSIHKQQIGTVTDNSHIV